MAKTTEAIDPFFEDISGADATRIRTAGDAAVSSLNRARRHPNPDNLKASADAHAAFCKAVTDTVRISTRMEASKGKGK